MEDVNSRGMPKPEEVCVNVYSERGTCIKGLFWPPLESKIENCFSQISFDWFIRIMTKV